MSRPLYDFPADVAFGDAARVALESSFRKMMDNAPGTRAGLEEEHPTPEGILALHDMRVGSRRLRAALSVFARVFPASELQPVARQVRDVTRALGAVRDLDVQIDHLRRLAVDLPANEAYGVERMVGRLVRQRNKRRKALLAALVLLDRDRFERRFLKLLDRALPPAPAPAAAPAEEADVA